MLSESEKIKLLEFQLYERDKFIVDRGLWSEFVKTLPKDFNQQINLKEK